MTNLVDERLVAALQSRLPDLERELLSALRAEVPLFARPLEGAYGRDVRTSTRVLLHGFVARVGDLDADRAAVLDRVREDARREVRLGRQIDGLLAAFRVVARVLWREVAHQAEQLGLDRAALTALGETVFAISDELSVTAAQAFAAEQRRSADRRARRDEALLTLLLREPPTDTPTLVAAAAAEGWTAPATVRAVAIAGEAADAQLAARLPAGALLARRGELLCLLIADHPGALATLRAAVGEHAAALGPAVPWPETSRSFRRAATALERLDPSHGLLVTDEHLPELLVHSDPVLLADIARRALAPLDGVRPMMRDRLLATLRAWLDHQGHQGATAHTLGLHQQTVRYRLGRLRDLLGPAMDDPDARFALELALRAPRR